ncbi:TPA: ead/Ea22-like family protein [Klebsiella oxytoca]
MTDTTELAQSLKAAAMEATLEKWYVDNDFDVCSENYGFVAELHGDNLVHNAQFIALANPANVLALVEALEKAQTENTASAAGMAESYETTISMLRSRIAELEESHAQVIQSRDHYKRMSEEGLKQLAESRTVTVKLPDIMPPEAAAAHYWGSGESMAYADGYNKSAADLKTSFALSCSSAGVNVEFE